RRADARCHAPRIACRQLIAGWGRQGYLGVERRARDLVSMALLCRVAENMFWLNRYVERGISIIRVVDVTAHLELDAGDAESQEIDFWTPLLGPAVGGVPHSSNGEGPQPLPHDVRYYLAFDADNPSSLVSCVRCARAAARQ